MIFPLLPKNCEVLCLCTSKHIFSAWLLTQLEVLFFADFTDFHSCIFYCFFIVSSLLLLLLFIVQDCIQNFSRHCCILLELSWVTYIDMSQVNTFWYVKYVKSQTDRETCWGGVFSCESTQIGTKYKHSTQIRITICHNILSYPYTKCKRPFKFLKSYISMVFFHCQQGYLKDMVRWNCLSHYHSSFHLSL